MLLDAAVPHRKLGGAALWRWLKLPGCDSLLLLLLRLLQVDAFLAATATKAPAVYLEAATWKLATLTTSYKAACRNAQRSGGTSSGLARKQKEGSWSNLWGMF